MDELEISKIFGAGCAALLAFVGLGQLGSAVVGVDQLAEPAYVVEVPETGDDGGETEVAAMPIGQMMAMADMDDGVKVFKKCAACHKAEAGGGNGIGPNLHGIVGRDIASVAGYDYSEALTSKEGPWDFAALSGFLEAPKKWANGTKMNFAGLSKPDDRASVIGWLNEQSDSPLPMPAVEPVADEAVVDPDVSAADANVMVAGAVGRKDEEDGTVVRVVDPEAVTNAEPTQTETAEVAKPEDGAEGLVVVPADAEEEPTESVVVMVDPVVAPAPEPEAATEGVASATLPDVTGSDFDAATVAFLATADMDNGAKVFRKCKACHRVEQDGGNAVGPNLYGVVGRDIAAVNGFDYSDALKGKDGVWDVESLNAYLHKPKEWAKGTKMAFAGLRKEEDRASIIVWLNTYSDVPIPLPE